jgi:hypothetical protein
MSYSACPVPPVLSGYPFLVVYIDAQARKKTGSAENKECENTSAKTEGRNFRPYNPLQKARAQLWQKT